MIALSDNELFYIEHALRIAKFNGTMSIREKVLKHLAAHGSGDHPRQARALLDTFWEPVAP